MKWFGGERVFALVRTRKYIPPPLLIDYYYGIRLDWSCTVMGWRALRVDSGFRAGVVFFRVGVWERTSGCLCASNVRV